MLLSTTAIVSEPAHKIIWKATLSLPDGPKSVKLCPQGLPWWPMGKWRLPAAEFEELANSMKAMGRLLFNLHLAFDEVP